ncbi:hypothetical protein [Bradyrhizobium sp. Ai1a-2]|uniref:hypothetical protein n=1 Tax=Bradyrhizobium sp. Ai1a-2 TaxID=196490 RepID=UPI000416732A|nr:hypothetical protein [Bradyrhizobium sp. Ai1a-2]
MSFKLVDLQSAATLYGSGPVKAERSLGVHDIMRPTVVEGANGPFDKMPPR